MSAWRIGRQAPLAPELGNGQGGTIKTPSGPSDPGVPPVLALSSGNTKVAAIADRLTKWIPGEVLTLYVAGVTVLNPSPGSSTGVVFLAIVAILTPAVVAGGVFATGGKFDGHFWISAMIGMAAFLIWSITVPESAWQKISLIADNPGTGAMAAAFAGLLLGQVADGLVLRLTGTRQ